MYDKTIITNSADELGYGYGYEPNLDSEFLLSKDELEFLMWIWNYRNSSRFLYEGEVVKKYVERLLIWIQSLPAHWIKFVYTSAIVNEQSHALKWLEQEDIQEEKYIKSDWIYV